MSYGFSRVNLTRSFAAFKPLKHREKRPSICHPTRSTQTSPIAPNPPTFSLELPSTNPYASRP
jgi:hypothetical protein